MRKIIIGKNERDLAAVAKRVLGEKDGAGLEALQRFNPHLVGHKVGAGTVLLVPDLPGLHAGTSSAIGGEAFADFVQQTLSALDVTTERVRSAHKARLVQRKEIEALLNSDAVQRAFEVDRELKAQAEAGMQDFEQDPERAQAADDTLRALKAMADSELAALGKLLG